MEEVRLQMSGPDPYQAEASLPTPPAAIDDATCTVDSALFLQQEDSRGCFLLLRDTVERRGIAAALHSNRLGILRRSPKEVDALYHTTGQAPARTFF